DHREEEIPELAVGGGGGKGSGVPVLERLEPGNRALQRDGFDEACAHWRLPAWVGGAGRVPAPVVRGSEGAPVDSPTSRNMLGLIDEAGVRWGHGPRRFGSGDAIGEGGP